MSCGCSGAGLVGAAVLGVPLTLLQLVPPPASFLRLRSGWCSRWRRRLCSGPSWPFHRAAAINLRHRTATMDTLISIGTLATWAWSTIVLFGLGEHLYFEVGAVTTTLVLLGRYLETGARRRSSAAIRALLQLGAKEAHVLREDVEVLVPVDELSATASSFVPAKDRDGRRRRGRILGRQPVDADGRVGSRRRQAGQRGRRRHDQCKRAARRTRHQGRSRDGARPDCAWSARRRRGRRRFSASSIASRASSCRSSSRSRRRPSSAGCSRLAILPSPSQPRSRC